MVSDAASMFTAVDSKRKAAAASTVPNHSACAGSIRPAGSGRLRVRPIAASMSRSNQQLIAFAPAAASQPPVTVAIRRFQAGSPRAAITIAATAVTSSRTTTRGLVSAT